MVWKEGESKEPSAVLGLELEEASYENTLLKRGGLGLLRFMQPSRLQSTCCFPAPYSAFSFCRAGRIIFLNPLLHYCRRLFNNLVSPDL